MNTQPKNPGNRTPVLVSVVDDDESVRESLPDLLREFGLEARAFSSPRDFLQSELIEDTRCLILDIVMPGMSGPELRHELLRRGHDIPTIFVTAHTDLASLPEIRDGLVDCLIKPFSEAALLEALRRRLNLK